MAATPADVRLIAPELTAETDPRIQFFIDLSGDIISERALGSAFNRAQALLVAHMMTLAARGGGASGAVASMSEGDVSISYAAPQSGKYRDYGLTSYGQMLQTLLNSRIVSALVTDPGC